MSNLVLVDVTDKAAAVAANDPAVVGALGDGAVVASCAGGDCLPDDRAVVADTELGSAVADDGTVGGAGTGARATSSGRRCRSSA